MKGDSAVDRAIAKLTSIDKLVVCLMLANKICFHGRVPRFYKNEETIRKMCPPKARQFFNLENLKRLGVVYALPNQLILLLFQVLG